ncbi:TonB-dependent receptor [cf. Phormidesmis sp. LEGE 11477]|uniref:TonB-dependent receptor n=1 Tax=cf. Phormidesmis sp. LEGE 11477 TaxID=1828680 RepID=UPI0018822F5A|nr:TonB-dependent receptor [cf. Phormidesmis sp. LEGE 11477]MBE9062968.1 TonB-dependent receptor [cf. Phormidesmis sp. LEGE 11477]
MRLKNGLNGFSYTGVGLSLLVSGSSICLSVLPALAETTAFDSGNAQDELTAAVDGQAIPNTAVLDTAVSKTTVPNTAVSGAVQIAQALDELTEADDPVITPPFPVRTEVINERIQGEQLGEIDEAVIHQVPDPLLLEDLYQIQISSTNGDLVAADRRSTLRLAGALTDNEGNLLDNDVVVTLTTSAGEFIGADYDIDRPGFQVLARRGEFTAELRSSLDAQRVSVRAAAARDDLLAQTPLPLEENLVDGAREIEGYADVSFITPLRPSLVTGVVDLRYGNSATDFGGSFRDFLNPDDIGEYSFDADVSVFATGAIGNWLITGAYNSDRTLNERCDGNRLYQDIQSEFCTYEIFGDSSTTDHLTPSSDSVYVRLQQDAKSPAADPNFFMWGDYSTNEFSRSSQLFSATSRQLHGFMGNYTIGGENSGLQLTAMYANNIRPFQRDTIVPDGTSGFYFLSNPLVFAGSEEIFIEVEEFNRPGTVVERIPLSRGADYRIDYSRGAILFSQPVTAVDSNPFGPALVRRIVATYQVDGQESGGELYGGRVQYNFSYDLESPSWIGASVVTESDNVRDFTLYGVDALVSLGDRAQLIGEYAQSSLSNTIDSDGNGSAFRLEARSDFTDNILGRVYYRQADEDFANTATSSFRAGQTRYGGEISAAIGRNTLLEFQYDQEENDGTTPQVLIGFDALTNRGFFPEQGTTVDNTLRTIRAGVQQQVGPATLDLSYLYRDRNDRAGDLDFAGSQLVSGLTVPLTGSLDFRAQNELNLSGDQDPLYPNRTIVGLDWYVLPEVTVRLAQQFFGDSDVAPDSITTLDALLDYDLSVNTQLTGRYSVLGGFDGVRNQGSLGLNHRVNLAPGLNVDLGYERIIGRGLGLVQTGERFSQPFAVGQSASALGLVPGSTYSVGLEYLDNPAFQASARAEYRDNQDTDDNTVITAALAGKLTRSLTALARYEQANYANQTLTGRFENTSSAKLGLAYRNPNSDFFNGLLSYEFATNPTTTLNTPGSDTITEHTLSAEAIIAPTFRWEIYGKYALRSTNADLSEVGLNSISNTIHLAQFRAAYRLGYRWDIAGEARYIAQPSADYQETAVAVETGYYVTPDLRLGVGYSFGAANDRSFQGSGRRDDSGFFIGATFKVNELLGGFGLQDIGAQQETESLVGPEDAIPISSRCPEDVDPEAGGIDPCENRAVESPSEPPAMLPVIPSDPESAPTELAPTESAPTELAPTEETAPAGPIRGLW